MAEIIQTIHDNNALYYAYYCLGHYLHWEGDDNFKKAIISYHINFFRKEGTYQLYNEIHGTFVPKFLNIMKVFKLDEQEVKELTNISGWILMSTPDEITNDTLDTDPNIEYRFWAAEDIIREFKNPTQRIKHWFRDDELILNVDRHLATSVIIPKVKKPEPKPKVECPTCKCPTCGRPLESAIPS